MEDTPESDTTQDQYVNYMPGMPRLSSEPSIFKRIFEALTARRGRLRPVVRDDEPTATTRSDV